MTAVKSLLPLLLSLAGAAVVASAQPAADLTRRARAEDKALVFAPDGPMLRAASLDQHEPLADLLWIRGVQVFGERWKRDPDPTWIAWLKGTVLAVADLDPGWRSPYFYGGSLLRLLGDIDGSDEIFARGADALPQDAYFPFNLGMNAYLYREDPTTAARWMERAAVTPGAASWYVVAAAAMRTRGGDREGAIAYLDRLRNEATSDAQRADAEMQLGRLYHDKLVDSFLPACAAYVAEHQRPPPSPEAFFAWAGTPVPVNPRGDAWIVGGDGCVRSAGAEQTRLYRLRKAERAFLR